MNKLIKAVAGTEQDCNIAVSDHVVGHCVLPDGDQV